MLKTVEWVVKHKPFIRPWNWSPHSAAGVRSVQRAFTQDAAREASLSLGGSGNGRRLHRHGSRGGLMMMMMMGVSGDLEATRPGRHQADGVTGEQWQILRIQEERRGYQVGCATRWSVGEQQVTSVQRRERDRAAWRQCCEEKGQFETDLSFT